MTANEQKQPALKTSIWYVGLLVSSFCIVAGVIFESRPMDSPLPAPFSRETATVIETAVPEAASAAQTCSCHPNKVPVAPPTIPNHGYPMRFAPVKGIVPVELPVQMPARSGPVFEWPVKLPEKPRHFYQMPKQFNQMPNQ